MFVVTFLFHCLQGTGFRRCQKTSALTSSILSWYYAVFYTHLAPWDSFVKQIMVTADDMKEKERERVDTGCPCRWRAHDICLLATPSH
jgi:hypothetical protein